MKRLLLVLSILVGAVPLQTARAADLNSVLDSWFAAQQKIQTWSADFTQTRSLKSLTQPLIGHGRVFFAAPSDFFWELGQPAQTIAVRHADTMYVVYPRLKRAELYPMGANAPAQLRAALSLLQAGFPRSRAEFDSQYNVVSLNQTNGNWVLTLQPKSSAARQMMSQMEIGLSPTDYSLASTKLVFADGSSLRNDFTNIVLNPSLDKALFAWTPPSDYTVANPLSQ
ncbi:MAG: LolA family protein [Limisphaerales bacterium]